MEMLQSVWKKMGKTLVIITHDSRIARMADRQFVIVDGVLSEVTARWDLGCGYHVHDYDNSGRPVYWYITIYAYPAGGGSERKSLCNLPSA